MGYRISVGVNTASDAINGEIHQVEEARGQWQESLEVPCMFDGLDLTKRLVMTSNCPCPKCTQRC